MEREIIETYGDRLRNRVCGLCWQRDALLLVDHALYDHPFWSPPGGGMEFGQSAHETLIREFAEETGLEVKVGDFRFVCEFFRPPFHALELFFDVTITGGTLRVGRDPETDATMIRDVRFFSSAELARLPAHHRHAVFSQGPAPGALKGLKGYLKL